MFHINTVRHFVVAFSILVGFACLIAFQNCGKGFQSAPDLNLSQANGLSSAEDFPIQVTMIPQPPNASNPAFNFTSDEANVTFLCRLDAATDLIDCDGSEYSPTGLQDGFHELTVQAVAADGRTSQAVVYSWTQDTTPPIVTVSQTPPALVPQNSNLNIEFSATDATMGVELIECSYDDGTFSACDSPHQIASPTPGSHSLKIRAIDKATNLSNTQTVSFAVQLGTPIVTILTKPAAVTNQKTASFSFTGIDGQSQALTSFQCSLNSAAFTTCTSPVNLNNLSESAPQFHTFRVRGIDSQNTISAPVSYSWIVDSTAPAITFNQTPPTLTQTNNVQFTFSITELGSGLKERLCQLNNTPPEACSTSKTYLGLASGNYQFRVSARDNAGNTSVAEFNFIVDIPVLPEPDTVKPVIQIVTFPSAYTKIRTAQFNFAVYDNVGIAQIECRIDNLAFTPCATSMTYSNLADGQHVFVIRATDLSGNVTSAQRTWLIDTSNPTLAVVGSVTSSKTFSASIVATDTGSGVNSVMCRLDNSAMVPCTSGASQEYTNVVSGTHTFTVVAQDKAGNAVTRITEFVIQ